jgi:PA domain-containing protein
MRKQSLPVRLAFLSLALIGILAFASSAALGQAVITIVNGDGANEGFNDPTPVAPVGGNTGTTLGQQRLIAFQFAANIWGNKLASNVEIRILARFNPQTCTATSAVLGSAGSTFIFRDFAGTPPFPGAVAPSTWHHSALADKRAGREVNMTPGQPDIQATFNSNLNGDPACLGGRKFYLGLDNNHGTDIDLVVVLLHEFAHGLGFSQFASVTTGAQTQNLSDVYGRQLLDLSTGKTWDQMTNAERAASAINSRRVVFTGPTVTAELPGVLSPGTPLLRVNAPAGIAGIYAVGTAAFGSQLSSLGITGNVVLALDAADADGPLTTDACTPLTNAAAVAGKIALVDRGTCGFTVKVKNAQDAGAIAVIVADNVAGGPPAGLGGADPTVTIPSARVTLADGNTIKAQLNAGVNVTLAVDLSVFSGADALGRALVNAPNPVQPGSSISHWDPVASRNQLMEPAINADLTHSVTSPEDLSLALMRDVGWFADADLDGIADNVDCSPNSDRRPTVIIDGCDTGVPNTFFLSGPNAGCTISDLIRRCAANAGNHGGFVSCVAHLTNELKKDGLITGSQKGAIMSCAAQAGLP